LPLRTGPVPFAGEANIRAAVMTNAPNATERLLCKLIRSSLGVFGATAEAAASRCLRGGTSCFTTLRSRAPRLDGDLGPVELVEGKTVEPFVVTRLLVGQEANSRTGN